MKNLFGPELKRHKDLCFTASKKLSNFLVRLVLNEANYLLVSVFCPETFIETFLGLIKIPEES